MHPFVGRWSGNDAPAGPRDACERPRQRAGIRLLDGNVRIGVSPFCCLDEDRRIIDGADLAEISNVVSANVRLPVPQPTSKTFSPSASPTKSMNSGASFLLQRPMSCSYPVASLTLKLELIEAPMRCTHAKDLQGRCLGAARRAEDDQRAAPEQYAVAARSACLFRMRRPVGYSSPYTHRAIAVRHRIGRQVTSPSSEHHLWSSLATGLYLRMCPSSSMCNSLSSFRFFPRTSKCFGLRRGDPRTSNPAA